MPIAGTIQRPPTINQVVSNSSNPQEITELLKDQKQKINQTIENYQNAYLLVEDCKQIMKEHISNYIVQLTAQYKDQSCQKFNISSAQQVELIIALGHPDVVSWQLCYLIKLQCQGQAYPQFQQQYLSIINKQQIERKEVLQLNSCDKVTRRIGASAYPPPIKKDQIKPRTGQSVIDDKSSSQPFNLKQQLQTSNIALQKQTNFIISKLQNNKKIIHFASSTSNIQHFPFHLIKDSTLQQVKKKYYHNQNQLADIKEIKTYKHNLTQPPQCNKTTNYTNKLEKKEIDNNFKKETSNGCVKESDTRPLTQHHYPSPPTPQLALPVKTQKRKSRYLHSQHQECYKINKEQQSFLFDFMVQLLNNQFNNKTYSESHKSKGKYQQKIEKSVEGEKEVIRHQQGCQKEAPKLALKQSVQQQRKQQTENLSCDISISSTVSSHDCSQIQMEPPQIRREDLQFCVGIIQAIWTNQYGRTELVGYSTAFAISPSLVITCAHSIYQTTSKRQCDSAYFIPVNGSSSYKDVYPTKKTNFNRFKKISSFQRYGFKPLREDIAVLALDRPLNCHTYLQIEKKELVAQDKLEIWGYPSKIYSMITPREGTQFKRQDLKGTFIRPKSDHKGEYILLHDMPTQGGHSGSPIIKVSEHKGKPRYSVVGMHSHKGLEDGTNQGLLMTKGMRWKILYYSISLCRLHGLLEDIEYIQKIYAVRIPESHLSVFLKQNDSELIPSADKEDEAERQEKDNNIVPIPAPAPSS